MKMLIKKIRNRLPINFYYALRFFKDFIFQKNISFKMSHNPKIWFLDSPDYENLGDQAIALGIIKFIKDNFSEHQLVEVLESDLIKNLSYLKKAIKKEDLIILQGGGNLGDIYPKYEFLRRQVIKNFPNNKIIIFPQSVWFSNTNKGYKEQNISSKIYGEHRYLNICARDSKSYETLKQIFPKNKILLCPDMALYLTNLIENKDRDGIAICLREDSEKISFTKAQKNFLNEIVQKYGKFENITTLLKAKGYITSNLRESLVLNKLKEFSKYQFVITDRLHGIIFSYITNTPCVFFPSKTGKAENLYDDWLKDCNFIFPYKKDIEIKSLFNNNNRTIVLDFSSLNSVLQYSKECKK